MGDQGAFQTANHSIREQIPHSQVAKVIIETAIERGISSRSPSLANGKDAPM